MQNFRDLIIWSQGIELAVTAYQLTRQFPKEEIYGLTSQIKRAVVSIPSNIAEGCSRESKNDFRRFLQISLGSAYELETDLIIAESLQFFKSDDLQKYLTGLHLEQRRLNSLISRIKAN